MMMTNNYATRRVKQHREKKNNRKRNKSSKSEENPSAHMYVRLRRNKCLPHVLEYGMYVHIIGVCMYIFAYLIVTAIANCKLQM